MKAYYSDLNILIYDKLFKRLCSECNNNYSA